MSLLTNAVIGTLVAQFFLAAAGTLSFAILFACPRRLLPYCALVGGVGWLVYELAVLLGADSTTASLLAVIPLTLLTRVLAILLTIPGVENFSALTVNGGTADVSIQADTIPVLGEVTVT